MVCAAEELGVGEVGFSSIRPVDDVVCVAPWHGCPASLPCATLVSLFKGTA